MTEGRKRLSDVPTTAAPSDGATIIVNDDGIKQVPRSAILQGALNADTINYDNASSGLSATDVQGAVDEVVSKSAWKTHGTFQNTNSFTLPSTWNAVNIYVQSAHCNFSFFVPRPLKQQFGTLTIRDGAYFNPSTYYYSYVQLTSYTAGTVACYYTGAAETATNIIVSYI